MPDDPHPVIPWLTAPRRKWLYGIVLAAQPLGAILGDNIDEAWPIVTALVLAVIGTGTALANVSDPT